MTLFRGAMPYRHRGQMEATSASTVEATTTSSSVASTMGGGAARVIHSGHFMISNPHRSDQDSSDDDDLSSQIQKRATAIQSVPTGTLELPQSLQRLAPRNVKFTSCAVDQSLNRLFQCLSLAYKDCAMTNPKWDTFKGLKWSMKDKIRLNNLIWREYHMQFVRKKPAVVVQFSFPPLDEVHTKAEACVLEGTYWRRRYESIEEQYHQWRLFYKHRLQQASARFGESAAMRFITPVLDEETARRIDEAEHAQLLEAVATQRDAAFRFASQPKCASPTPGGVRSVNFLDDPSMDFEQLLSFINQPLSNPDLYQPTLFPFQPNMPLDNMDTEIEDNFSDLLLVGAQNQSSTTLLLSNASGSQASGPPPFGGSMSFATPAAASIDPDYDLFPAPMITELGASVQQSRSPMLPYNPVNVPQMLPVGSQNLLLFGSRQMNMLPTTSTSIPLAPSAMQATLPSPQQAMQAVGNAANKPLIQDQGNSQRQQMPMLLSPNSARNLPKVGSVSTLQQPTASCMPSNSSLVLQRNNEQQRALSGSQDSFVMRTTVGQVSNAEPHLSPVAPQLFTAPSMLCETLDSLQPLRGNGNSSTLRPPNERSVSVPTYHNSSLLASLLQNKNDSLLANLKANRSVHPTDASAASNHAASSAAAAQKPGAKAAPAGGPRKKRNARVLSQSAEPEQPAVPITSITYAPALAQARTPESTLPRRFATPFVSQAQTAQPLFASQSHITFTAAPSDVQQSITQTQMGMRQRVSSDNRIDRQNEYQVRVDPQQVTTGFVDLHHSPAQTVMFGSAQSSSSPSLTIMSTTIGNNTFLQTLGAVSDESGLATPIQSPQQYAVASSPSAAKVTTCNTYSVGASPLFLQQQLGTPQATFAGLQSSTAMCQLAAGPFQASAASSRALPFLPQAQVTYVQAAGDNFVRPAVQQHQTGAETNDSGSATRVGMKSVQSDTSLRDLSIDADGREIAHRELSLNTSSGLELQQNLQHMTPLNTSGNASGVSLAPVAKPAQLSSAIAQLLPFNTGRTVGLAIVQNATQKPNTNTNIATFPTLTNNITSMPCFATQEKDDSMLRHVSSTPAAVARHPSSTRHRAPFLEQLLVSPDSTTTSKPSAAPLMQQARPRNEPFVKPNLPAQARTDSNVATQRSSVLGLSGAECSIQEQRAPNRLATTVTSPNADIKPTVTLLDAGDGQGSPRTSGVSKTSRTWSVPLGAVTSPNDASSELPFASANYNYTESVASSSSSDQKRVIHITAEAKRRSHLRNSLHVLQSLIPAFNPTGAGSPSNSESGSGHAPVKVSKAVLLQEVTKYITRLRAEARQDEEAIASEKETIERYNAEIEAYQRQLPVTGVELSSSVTAAACERDRTVQLWNAYKDARISAHGWKFYVFTLIFEPFLERYAQALRGATEDEFEKCVLVWLDQSCGIHAIRQQATAAVRFVCSKTSITATPNALSAPQARNGADPSLSSALTRVRRDTDPHSTTSRH